MSTSTQFHIIRLDKGRYEVRHHGLVGTRLGMMLGRAGWWVAEYRNGASLGRFKSRQAGAQALHDHFVQQGLVEAPENA